MDHLDIPINTHRINYSLPRACFVTSNDFNFIVEIDLDNSNPNKKTIFGKRPVMHCTHFILYSCFFIVFLFLMQHFSVFLVQFLELSKTVYGSVAGPSNDNVEVVELNPSASLKDWIEFPSMQDLEVLVFVFFVFRYVL